MTLYSYPWTLFLCFRSSSVCFSARLTVYLNWTIKYALVVAKLVLKEIADFLSDSGKSWSSIKLPPGKCIGEINDLSALLRGWQIDFECQDFSNFCMRLKAKKHSFDFCRSWSTLILLFIQRATLISYCANFDVELRYVAPSVSWICRHFKKWCDQLLIVLKGPIFLHTELINFRTYSSQYLK